MYLLCLWIWHNTLHIKGLTHEFDSLIISSCGQRRLWSDYPPSLIWVFTGRTLILLVLSCRGSNLLYRLEWSSLLRDTFCSLQWYIVCCHWLPWPWYPKSTMPVWMEGHAPLLLPCCQFVEIFLEYGTVVLIPDLPVQDTVIREEPVLDWTQSGRSLINSKIYCRTKETLQPKSMLFYSSSNVA